MSTSIAPGRTLGHYQIVDTIGQGGMGAVYKAIDTRLGRQLAIKVIRGEHDSASRLRFLREAQTASSLNHPNIITIYEIGSEGDDDYIAMELIPGGTLSDLLESGPVPADRALLLAHQIADALAAAHAASVVHRDLKPSNIMMATPDRVKVVDFGLAKFTLPSTSDDETAQRLTQEGAIVGTAPYMSPEQAAGLDVDDRSDLFSLGAVLYEMLAGRRAFPGRSAVETVAAILRDTPPQIEGIRPDVSRLVDRCLAKKTAERFQSALELKSAIESCLAAADVRETPSVAVLPFTMMSGATADAFLCEGLAEEIINELTRIEGLRVAARTSSFAVARMGLEIREAAGRLGVGTILCGSVRREGQRVRVAVQLIKADDATHLWSEQYDREIVDALRLEEEIARAIAARLRLDLTHGARQQPQPFATGDAYALYLEGRYYFARGTPEALGKALALYQQAIAVDPAAALAYDSLAELYWYLGFFGNVPPREAFSTSVWHALRALELDDTLAQTHALLGMLRKELDYNWPEVDRELQRAMQLNAASPLVRLRYAISGLLPHGRVDEAAAEITALLKSDPLSLPLRWWLSIMLWLARLPLRTLEEGRHMIALDPTHFFGYWSLGLGMVATGDITGAVAAFEKAHELSGGIPFTLGFLAWAYGLAGRRDDAAKSLDIAKKLATTGYVPPTTFALAHLGLGETEAALDRFDEAIDRRDPIIMPIKTFPFLDPLRSHPRFRDLLRKMNLE